MNAFEKAKLERAHREVERVLEFGDLKHPGNTWKHDALGCLMDHADGHRSAIVRGYSLDKESKCHNLAHSIARDMMSLQKLLEFQDERRGGKEERGGDA